MLILILAYKLGIDSIEYIPFYIGERYIFYAVYAELISENENQHRDKSNNLPNVLSFVTRYLVRRGDLRPCH